MMFLTLVRHGETEENVAHILQGRMPGTLTKKGWKQIGDLESSLEGRRFDVVLSSPLRRAVQTAQELNRVLQLPLVEEPLLQERDWGELTGHSVEEARALMEMPDSVESVEAMFGRARVFLRKMVEAYDGKRVLAVTHGLFARCIQAAHYGVTIRDIPPMKNTEMRFLRLNAHEVDDGKSTNRVDVVSDR